MREKDRPMANRDKELVVTYTITIHLPAIARGSKSTLLRDFNLAWGFEDGNCNKLVDDTLVPITPVPKGFEAAHRKLHRPFATTLEVSVFRDGTRTCRVVEGSNNVV
jgi:hypothetical protein